MQKERRAARRVVPRRVDRGGEIGAGLDNPRAELADARRLYRIGILRQEDRRGNAEQLRRVGDRRTVVPGAGADDLGDRATRQVGRQRIDRAADLERSGRQLGFDFEEDVVAG